MPNREASLRATFWVKTTKVSSSKPKFDKDGAVLSRVADSYAYEAVLYWYADLASDRPRAHSFLRDVQ